MYVELARWQHQGKVFHLELHLVTHSMHLVHR